mmetsp:Transcript_34180/g.53437  ORF Transcript_34180/g.53437 Transcript_34180/m.53437 type:complete len:102 (-) Transcript_34180:130-435(-)
MKQMPNIPNLHRRLMGRLYIPCAIGIIVWYASKERAKVRVQEWTPSEDSKKFRENWARVNKILEENDGVWPEEQKGEGMQGAVESLMEDINLEKSEKEKSS